MKRREFLRRASSGVIAITVAPEVLSDLPHFMGSPLASFAPETGLTLNQEINVIWRKAQAELVDSIRFSETLLPGLGEWVDRGVDATIHVSVGKVTNIDRRAGSITATWLSDPPTG